ncbi:hypothetical protein [Streptomyces sp. NPDC059874]|uniref:hypothetical protein n=1 Tax=Streptomyces sp. NPDC059874 TaxID=3346983 RepID=UPI003662C29D
MTKNATTPAAKCSATRVGEVARADDDPAGRGDERQCGQCRVHEEEHEAVAQATLDARHDGLIEEHPQPHPLEGRPDGGDAGQCHDQDQGSQRLVSVPLRRLHRVPEHEDHREGEGQQQGEQHVPPGVAPERQGEQCAEAFTESRRGRGGRLGGALRVRHGGMPPRRSGSRQ